MGSPYDRVIVSMAGNICFADNFSLINRLARVGAIGTSKTPQLKGRPDLLWHIPRQKFTGLAIELKKDRKSRITPEETEYLTFLQQQGYFAIRADGADEAIEIISNYLRL